MTGPSTGAADEALSQHNGELPVAAASASSPVPVTYQDIDSEELEALEDAADEESESDTEIDRLLDEAALLYPPEQVAAMVKELKQRGMAYFLQRYVLADPTPFRIKQLLLALGVFLPRSIRNAPDMPISILLPILKTALSRILRRREKLPQYNTVHDAVGLLRDSKNIVVLSGAGISVSCGIPDFRSKEGIYAQLQREGTYDLDEPQDMFDKGYFLANPAMFYSFAHRIFPSNFVPSNSHRFIKLLEDKDKLLRNYSQNIDTLEQVAGITKVLQCHGSFATASCTSPTCGYKCKGSEIKADIFDKKVPQCPRCQAKISNEPTAKRRKTGGAAWRRQTDESDEEDDDGLSQGLGILKPDITFFGEKLDDSFDHAVYADREKVDLLVIIGTSLKVAPVSELITHIPHSTPVILINKTPVYHIATDVMLLGDSDGIVDYLCDQLGWQIPKIEPDQDVIGKDDAKEVAAVTNLGVSSEHETVQEPTRLLNSHCWAFAGAEVGRLPQLLAEALEDDSDDGGEQDGHEDDKDGQDDAVPVPTTSQTYTHTQGQ